MKPNFLGTAVKRAAMSVMVFFVSSLLLGVMAQTAIPTLKTVTVEAEVSGKSRVSIKYKQIENSAGNSVWAQINREIVSRIVSNSGATSMRSYAKLVAKEYAEEYGYYTQEYGYSTYMHIEQSASIVRNKTILCIETNEEFYTGGAHGMYGQDVDCYNLATGQRYDLSYLSTGNWVISLRQLLYIKCREKLGELLQVTADKIEVPTVAKLTSRGVAFIFQPYEVASFSEGIIEVEVTDAELRSIGVPIKW